MTDPVPPQSPPVSLPPNPPETRAVRTGTARSRTAAANLRLRLRIMRHLGINTFRYQQIPRLQRAAIREALDEVLARAAAGLDGLTLYASMYGIIREEYGFLWRNDRSTRY